MNATASSLLRATTARSSSTPSTSCLRAHTERLASAFSSPAAWSFAAPWLFREDDRVAGRFRVIRRIARGAMGEVYEVYDERLRLQIALKAIRPELVGDPRPSSASGARCSSRGTSRTTGLCRIFDLVEHHDRSARRAAARDVVPCLTMQLLEGREPRGMAA